MKLVFDMYVKKLFNDHDATKKRHYKNNSLCIAMSCCTLHGSDFKGYLNDEKLI